MAIDGGHSADRVPAETRCRRGDATDERGGCDDTDAIFRCGNRYAAMVVEAGEFADGRGIRFRRVITNNPRSRYGTAD